jgi:hypothetical protein
MNIWGLMSPKYWTPNKDITSIKMTRKYASFTKEFKPETLKLAEPP